MCTCNRQESAIAQSFGCLRGEVLFLRAYYYFILVQYYGGVPLKLVPTEDIVNVDIPRNTIAETYDQILKDMEAAETLVPAIKTLGFGGAISKSAVRGYLAKVNLTMAGAPLNDKTRYAEASKWAKMVMDDADAAHSLNPSYPQVFMNWQETNTISRRVYGKLNSGVTAPTSMLKQESGLDKRSGVRIGKYKHRTGRLIYEHYFQTV